MAPQRRSDRFLVVLGGLIILSSVTAADVVLRGDAPPAVPREQVERLGLTDLAVATAARYTRHPALADRHAAFQDHPGALDHFPAGAVLPPPPHLRAP
jgi:hypothetical protein